MRIEMTRALIPCKKMNSVAKLKSENFLSHTIRSLIYIIWSIWDFLNNYAIYVKSIFVNIFLYYFTIVRFIYNNYPL